MKFWSFLWEQLIHCVGFLKYGHKFLTVFWEVAPRSPLLKFEQDLRVIYNQNNVRAVTLLVFRLGSALFIATFDFGALGPN